MTLEEKIEKIIADNNNKLLDAVNGLTNPTLGELVEPASRAILAAIKEELKARLLQWGTEQYKKGYIDGGIGVINE